jgi:hypothetical protein
LEKINIEDNNRPIGFFCIFSHDHASWKAANDLTLLIETLPLA